MALTIGASWASIGPGTVTPEGGPEVHAEPSVEAGLGQAPLRALTARPGRGRARQGQIRRQHGLSIHLQVLQAAHKALLAPCVVGHWIISTSNIQMQEGLWHQSSAWWDRRALQAEPGLTRAVPELQLHRAVHDNFHFVPLAIVHSQPLQEQWVPNTLPLQLCVQDAIHELQEQELGSMAAVKQDSAGQSGSEAEGHAGSSCAPPALTVLGQLNEEKPSGSKGERCWCRACGIIETRLALAQVAVALSSVGWDAQGLVLAVVLLAPSELDRAVLPSPRDAILARGTVAGIVSNAILTDSSVLAGFLLTLIDVNSTFHTCRRDLEMGSHPGTALPALPREQLPARSPTLTQSILLMMQESENQISVSSQVLFTELWPVSPNHPLQLLSCPKLKPHRQSMCRRHGRIKTTQKKNLCIFLIRFGMLKGQGGP